MERASWDCYCDGDCYGASAVVGLFSFLLAIDDCDLQLLGLLSGEFRVEGRKWLGRPRLEQLALLGDFLRIEPGAQQADDDKLPLPLGHVAHDEVQVAGGNVLAVFLGHHL